MLTPGAARYASCCWATTVDLATVALYDGAEPPLHAGLRLYWLDSEGETQYPARPVVLAA